MKPATKEDLDQVVAQGCQVPGCEHKHGREIYIRPKCHPRDEVSLSYNPDTGNLRVACAFCDKTIVEIAVASDNPSGVTVLTE